MQLPGHEVRRRAVPLPVDQPGLPLFGDLDRPNHAFPPAPGAGVEIGDFHHAFNQVTGGDQVVQVEVRAALRIMRMADQDLHRGSINDAPSPLY